jgi:YidC/Oxa1 family membrane protein insertase
MGELWNLLLFHPFVNALILLYKVIGNFGVAIILLTIILRIVLTPLTLPSMKAAKEMAELAPELEKLKKKYGQDKQKLAQAQMDFYKQKGINPAAGCLPQIIQIVILIALYQAFAQVLQANGDVSAKLNELLYPALKLSPGSQINLSFLYLNLGKPDMFNYNGIPLPGIFLLLAALTQFLSSKMMQPQVKKEEAVSAETAEKTDDLAASMQGQMLYMFPLMTLIIGFSFPSGLVLYWFVFSAFQLVQQYFISGWGGLLPWVEKLKRKMVK